MRMRGFKYLIGALGTVITIMDRNITSFFFFGASAAFSIDAFLVHIGVCPFQSLLGIHTRIAETKSVGQKKAKEPVRFDALSSSAD